MGAVRGTENTFLRAASGKLVNYELESFGALVITHSERSGRAVLRCNCFNLIILHPAIQGHLLLLFPTAAWALTHTHSSESDSDYASRAPAGTATQARIRPGGDSYTRKWMEATEAVMTARSSQNDSERHNILFAVMICSTDICRRPLHCAVSNHSSG